MVDVVLYFLYEVRNCGFYSVVRRRCPTLFACWNSSLDNSKDYVTEYALSEVDNMYSVHHEEANDRSKRV